MSETKKELRDALRQVTDPANNPLSLPPKREPGFYWIRFDVKTKWEIAEYLGVFDGESLWIRTGTDKFTDEVFIFKIDENRIINPNI